MIGGVFSPSESVLATHQRTGDADMTVTTADVARLQPVAELLSRCSAMQHSGHNVCRVEGPATCQINQDFPWFSSVGTHSPRSAACFSCSRSKSNFKLSVQTQPSQHNQNFSNCCPPKHKTQLKAQLLSSAASFQQSASQYFIFFTSQTFTLPPNYI